MLRVLMVCVALVAAPLVTSVAQERGNDNRARNENRGDDAKKCKDQKDKKAHPEGWRNSAPNSSAREAHARNEQRKADRACADAGDATPPPPTQPPPQEPPQEPPPQEPPPQQPPPEPVVGIGEIHGTAFVDVAGNMFWDWGDFPAEGWVIELSGPVNATATTDVNGNYAFTALPGGTYLVCEVAQAGWTQTAPFSGAGCASGGFGYTRVIPPNQQIRFIGNDFGNMPNP